jgi:hypothetical protein
LPVDCTYGSPVDWGAAAECSRPASETVEPVAAGPGPAVDCAADAELDDKASEDLADEIKFKKSELAVFDGPAETVGEGVAGVVEA